jgi:hypothetical protein
VRKEPPTNPLLFGTELPKTLPRSKQLRVTSLARKIVYAIRAIGRPATEREIIKQGERMRLDGMTTFLLGSGSNLRNCIQRHCSAYSEFKNHNYEDIFILIKRPGERPRYWVREDFVP